MSLIFEKIIDISNHFFVFLLLLFGKIYHFLDSLSQAEILAISIIGIIIILIIIYRILGAMGSMFFLFLFIILYVLYSSNINSVMDTYTNTNTQRLDKYNEEIDKNDIEADHKQGTTTEGKDYLK